MRTDCSEKPKVLIPEGHREFVITGATIETSKSGNEMLVLVLTDIDLMEGIKLYAITEPGKNYKLKQVLEACGIQPEIEIVDEREQIIFDWDLVNIANKEVICLVKHETNPFTKRNGEVINITKAVIVEVEALIDGTNASEREAADGTQENQKSNETTI